MLDDKYKTKEGWVDLKIIAKSSFSSNLMLVMFAMTKSTIL